MTIGVVQQVIHGNVSNVKELLKWVANEDEIVRWDAQRRGVEFSGDLQVAVLRRSVKTAQQNVEDWQNLSDKEKQTKFIADQNRIQVQNENAQKRAQKIRDRLLIAQEELQALTWPDELAYVHDLLLKEIEDALDQEGTPELEPVWESRQVWYQYWLDKYRDTRDDFVAALAVEEAKPGNAEKVSRLRAWEDLLEQVGVAIR